MSNSEDGVAADPALDGVALMTRDVERASEASPSTVRHFDVGGAVARFRFIGTHAEPVLTRAIAHLETGEAEPSLDVTVWDSSSTGVPLSPLLQYIADTAGAGTLTPRQEFPPFCSDRIRTTVQGWDGKFTIYDSRLRRAWVWIEDPSKLPLWDLGAPFRSLFNWWFADIDRFCIHAGAVGTPDGGVVLTGKGGSGKSTSSLACIGTELGYLSDDYCVLSMADSPEVLSLYNTGKLRSEDDLDRQPRFRPWVVNAERIGEEKQLVFVHEHEPDAILKRAPLRAVILPAVTADAQPQFTRVSGAAALRALAPTSLFQLPGSGALAMTVMAQLVRIVPCYRMGTGTDVGLIPEALGRLLAALNEGDRPDVMD